MQLVKAGLPAGEVEFDGQAIHVEIAEAPPAVEYVPAPQSVQVIEDPTAAEYVPAPQSVQASVPVNALYFPATHAAHGLAGILVYPALQVQFVKAALPAGELELVGQAVHDASVVCPVAIFRQ